MNNLFHVKQAGFDQNRCSPRVWVGLLMALLVGQSALAQVHKCTAPDGRVIFSDQACAAGQTGGATKLRFVASAAPVVSASKDASEASRVATRARLRAAQTPECRELGDRVARHVQQGTGQTPEATVKSDMARFEQLCAAQARDAMQAEMALKTAERKQLETQQACQEKRRVLNDRLVKKGSLSAADQHAVNTLESEVARDCR